ncbi:probable terpene synthase 11 [Cajanus cajan]|uniref:probable terpene synthase 11 n=1 Tax=Cajanus cajan TaxID=3821 RepID=UPI00098DA57A|nr:probable terpene synthase 11 [Cajanus cajan]
MSLNAIMAVTDLGVSLFTTSLAFHHSRPFMYQPRNLSLQTLRPGTMRTKLSIKSISLPDQVPNQTNLRKKSLEQLKRSSQEALLNTSDSLRTLKTIDTIQRLGIEHHFKEEINLQLGRLTNWEPVENLFATALQFRLLRHNGWPTRSDVFNKFLDKSGNFKESVTKDIWGMLSLYESSYLGTKDEEVLQQAMDFSRAHLHRSLPYLSLEVKNIVGGALMLPRHLRMARLEAKNYMVECRKTSSQIPDLLKLARLDFDISQSMHQKELAEISRWWKNLGLVESIGFGRDKPGECFLWVLGILPEPCYSNCRIELAKAISVLQVMDDMFDTHGKLDELVPFTMAIRRWDLDAMEQLPEYMKICYMALYNTIHEIAYRIQKEHGKTVITCIKRTWIDIFEAYLKEAKWFNNKYVPTFREYLDNGVISSASFMALVHSTLLIGDNLSEKTISMMIPYPRIFSCSGEILRLWDDLGTSRDEQKRGDNACSIQCLMAENNISDENVARKHIRKLIGNLWLELNGLALTTTDFPLSVARTSLNMARAAQAIYQHGDDQSSLTVDDQVQALLFTPSANY